MIAALNEPLSKTTKIPKAKLSSGDRCPLSDKANSN